VPSGRCFGYALNRGGIRRAQAPVAHRRQRDSRRAACPRGASDGRELVQPGWRIVKTVPGASVRDVSFTPGTSQAWAVGDSLRGERWRSARHALRRTPLERRPCAARRRVELAQRHLCSLGLDTATDAWRLAPALTSDDVTHTACPLGDQDSALLNEVGQRMGGGEVRLRRRLGPSHCSALARAGTRWRVVPSPPRADLEGVSGVSPSDIWAVGYPTRCSTGTVPPGRSSPSPVDAQTSTVRLHDVEMRPSGSGWSVGANADAGYILRHCPG
jgi:hypothetical protein